MSKTMKHSFRMLLVCLCIALLLTNSLILAPEVGAASDTNKTETDLILTDDTPTADDVVLTQRAITMDEAKKEAQAAVSEQLAIIAAVEEEKKEDVIETQASEAAASDTASGTSASQSASSSSYYYSDENKKSDSAASTVQAVANTGFLIGIDNPDPNYTGCSVALSAYDRDLAERIVMGEAGCWGFDGMAIVAQCLRDTYVCGGYSNIADVINGNGWYGSMSYTPSATCKQVISYIFDQGGSAVQHRVRVFYATNYCSSPWHEAQNFVCQYEYVRFFDF